MKATLARESPRERWSRSHGASNTVSFFFVWFSLVVAQAVTVYIYWWTWTRIGVGFSSLIISKPWCRSYVLKLFVSYISTSRHIISIWLIWDEYKYSMSEINNNTCTTCEVTSSGVMPGSRYVIMWLLNSYCSNKCLPSHNVSWCLNINEFVNVR